MSSSQSLGLVHIQHWPVLALRSPGRYGPQFLVLAPVQCWCDVKDPLGGRRKISLLQALPRYLCHEGRNEALTSEGVMKEMSLLPRANL